MAQLRSLIRGRILYWTTIVLMTGIIIFLGPKRQAVAGETETRNFQIFVDDKEAGKYQMIITANQDGSISVAAEAKVHVTFLVFKYTYTYKGVETWRGNRLIHLESNSNDDGQKFTVSAVGDEYNLRVKTNGRERTVQPDVWTTTYWRLPQERLRIGQISLLDADTGRSIDAKIQYLGTSSLNVSGRMQNCTHFKIIGEKIRVNAWFDSQERLVHQESLENGHKTVLKLASIGR